MSSINYTKQLQVMGHPAGLFVLFFTEMWERFSYYGMRALLVLFLVSSHGIGGWEWSNKEALTLYGTYTGLVYLTPILGGLIADKITGYRLAIIIGAFLMTLGHASMAFETEMTFYLGLGLLIAGNGLFKPNISSVVGGLYKGNEDKKDAGYTLFYMGINAGAFLGIMLCGYVGEKEGWSYGFGLAGIFMLFGMLQFWFARNIFGKIGLKPVKTEETKQEKEEVVDKKVQKDRLMVIFILAFFTIFFWMCFEQAGGSMTIFAKDFTNRILSGNYATMFTIINTIITVVPVAVISWVLILLAKSTFKHFALSNLFLTVSFLIIWGIIGWMINKDFNTKAYEIKYADTSTVIREDANLAIGNEIDLIDVNGKGKLKYLTSEKAQNVEQSFKASVTGIKENEVEVPASWFGILNSLFIILFAPLFSKLWASKYNPTAPFKFGMGLILLGLGFGILSLGSQGLSEGTTTSMVWLILAYLLHTLGELTLSPVGLSYVTKLSPPKLVGLMFGVWFISSAIANKIGGLLGGYIDVIQEKYSMSFFFLIFTFIPIIAGLFVMVLNKFLLKKMHGIR